MFMATGMKGEVDANFVWNPNQRISLAQALEAYPFPAMSVQFTLLALLHLTWQLYQRLGVCEFSGPRERLPGGRQMRRLCRPQPKPLPD